MEPSSSVTVYNFRLLGVARDGPKLSPHKATRRTILHALKGEVIEGTAEEVDAALVDCEGVYRRISTSCIDLN